MISIQDIQNFADKLNSEKIYLQQNISKTRVKPSTQYLFVIYKVILTLIKVS